MVPQAPLQFVRRQAVAGRRLHQPGHLRQACRYVQPWPCTVTATSSSSVGSSSDCVFDDLNLPVPDPPARRPPCFQPDALPALGLVTPNSKPESTIYNTLICKDFSRGWELLEEKDWNVTCLQFAPNAPDQTRLKMFGCKERIFLRRHFYENKTFNKIKSSFLNFLNKEFLTLVKQVGI